MEKKKQRRLLIIWSLTVVSIRILYFFLGNKNITDTYEYYAHAMIELGDKEPLLTSGLAYAYTQNLTDLLGFVGNRIEPLAAYQMILQVVWLLVFFFGMKMLFGNMGGVVAGSILAVSPWILETMFVVSTENFFMLFFAVLLFAFGFFYKRTKSHGWYRSNGCEIYLMLTGFFLGVVCIWNYVGWLLIVIMIYVLLCNYRNLEEKLWQQKQSDDLEEKYQLMPAYSQAFILLSGILTGMFATLMKYTGLTGIPVVEQFVWWTDQFKLFWGRCQDISINLAIWLVAAIATGVLCENILKALQRKRLIKEMYDEEEVLVEKEPSPQEENIIFTDDGRKISLLDNPLPVPKKHVKKELEFKINVSEDAIPDGSLEDDFDYSISENDDFDV